VATLHFFIGKGGVGKTTVSAAYAVESALRNPRRSILLLSTDPAHSLSDVLEQSLGDKPARVPLPKSAKLHAWQVNAEKQFRQFLNANKKQILSILERGSIFSREDIEPLLDTTLPGMAEMSALLALDEALRRGKYHQIIVDTAPFGHTLRLFELPEHFLRFLDFLELAASRDRVLAAHFGGGSESPSNRILQDWRELVASIQEAFASHAELVLVTTAEKLALNESLRCAAVLRSHSPPLEINSVVLNRAILGLGACRICRLRREATRRARARLKEEFRGKRLYLGEDPGMPIVGTVSLRWFGEHVFSKKRLVLKSPAPESVPLHLSRAAWPTLQTPLALVLGKGGVGKTTISAALGFSTRTQSRSPVEICSVDPAPSLDDVFETNVNDDPKPVLGDPQFRASEMDAVALFQRWAADIKDMIDQATSSNQSGIHIDFWFERQWFRQLLDSVPPGVDEILAVFRILDLLAGESNRVVVDMAPTGHALELLRTPRRILAWTRLLLKTLAAHRTLALARDAGVKVAELGHRVRELLRLLRNSQYTRIHTVMLAEYLPDRETERLIRNLDKLELASPSIFVNRVLFREDIGNCRRCARARDWQFATLRKLRHRYRQPDLYLVRNFPNEITGKNGLRRFTGELWRVE
jgi:arsenite/tail-anchored protein-transporting ATPase